MAPIRIGLIGLSVAAKTSWASEAHLPYLLSERGQQRYKIVALLNSSEEAAKRAREAYNLSTNVRTYGSPEALAKDPDADLVVCNTRVDKHYETVKPSVEAGKDVFVEWPLAENLHRATELANLAKQSGSRTVIGLQGRVAPSVLKVKELLQTGRIGKVLSSDIRAFTPGSNRDNISEGLGYFLDKKVGGNPMTIAFAHMIDYVHSILGEYDASHAHLQIQRPSQNIVNRETGATRPTQSDVPDLLSLHGTLKPSAFVADGASLIANFRIGPPFPGTPPFVWTITGETGQICISSNRGPFIQSEAGNLTIELEDFKTEKVEHIAWNWESWQEPLLPRGRNLAKVYDLFFEGRGREYGLADFSGAVQRHAQLDKLLY